MAGPNPWQAKAARDTGESATTHGSETTGSAEPTALPPHESASSAGGGVVAVSGEFVGGGTLESDAGRSGGPMAPRIAGEGSGGHADADSVEVDAPEVSAAGEYAGSGEMSASGSSSPASAPSGGSGAAARGRLGGAGFAGGAMAVSHKLVGGGAAESDAVRSEAQGPEVRASDGSRASEGAGSRGRGAAERSGESMRRRAGAVRGRVAAVRGVGTPLQGHWGYLVAAVGAFITLVLMTRPWLVATGANGSVESTAFGRIDISTKYLTVWSKSAPKTPQVSGLWAFATAAVIVLTICLVVLYFRMRSEYFARLVAGSSVAVAVLVLFTMLYLDSKGAELKALTARKYDLGGQVGQFLSWVKGNGKFILPGASQGQYVATARFTPSAVAAAAVAVISALAAVTQWMVGRGVEPGGLMAKVAVLREKWDAAGRAAAAKPVPAGSGARRTGSGAAEPATAHAGFADEPATAEPAGAQADSTGPSSTGATAGERAAGTDR
ncbi:hypothetical protein IU485_15345 [Nocardia cyriacigeorgica]|uniref:hypothetical protein n=1 Tax=Nocardia cyriacigeorgica TaxID=135487 RepID=UPI001894D48D|nr:hypothetical protein [Nocardia cyriacigeorgica]MBF6082740.1 hypothetical protein [Nocardia cyriacigeorgica]